MLLLLLFQIQPEFPENSIAFVNNLMPGFLQQHFKEECKMAYLSAEINCTVCGRDRFFSVSLPLLPVFVQHRCSTTDENYLRFDRFHIILLLS